MSGAPATGRRGAHGTVVDGALQCGYHAAGLCASCTVIDVPYAEQLASKAGGVEELLAPLAPDLAWLAPVASAPMGFRTKAKMAVAGSVEHPTIGILDAEGRGQDLRECPLYPPALAEAFPVLAAFVTRARLEPYDVSRRHGELKHVLVTVAPDGALLVRWVLRSTEAHARILKHLPWLRERLPRLAVASINVQPEHKAVLEGEREIVLTERETLTMTVNGIDLHLRPQSFFQTNTQVAAALCRQATAWLDSAAPASVWDLYCGVGGFALHVAGQDRRVVGVETSAQAVASAERTRDERRAAGEAAMAQVRFETADAVAWATARAAPEALIVNPPRRGLGEVLSRWIDGTGARALVYSSCNPATLARDLAWMPTWRPRQARLFDMFPHTRHGEVAVVLERR